jgi:hypothetical protein
MRAGLSGLISSISQYLEIHLTSSSAVTPTLIGPLACRFVEHQQKVGGARRRGARQLPAPNRLWWARNQVPCTCSRAQRRGSRWHLRRSRCRARRHGICPARSAPPVPAVARRCSMVLGRRARMRRRHRDRRRRKENEEWWSRQPTVLEILNAAAVDILARGRTNWAALAGRFASRLAGYGGSSQSTTPLRIGRNTMLGVLKDAGFGGAYDGPSHNP